MQNKGLLIAGVIILIAFVGYFLFGRQDDFDSPTAQQVPAPGATDVEEMVVSPEKENEAEDSDEKDTEDMDVKGADTQAREITVSGSEFSFSPSTITVQEGESIMLTFSNSGSATHNLIIQELGVETRTIGAGQTDTIEFVAEEAATLSFHCSVGNHRALGMEGELIVE